MNILEHYIEKVHSVEMLQPQEWMKEPFVRVDVTVNCYGNIERKKRDFPLSYWEDADEKGYFMW